MRVSTSMLYQSGVAGMQTQTQQLLQTQQEISAGSKLLTPSDNPVAAAQALQVTQAQSINQQYSTNANSASDSLGTEQNALTSLTQLLQTVNSDAVSAGNGSLSSSDRANLASAIEQQYQQLLAVANTTDANGQYIFSGYQGNTQAFTPNASGGVTYNGDQGQRSLQISPTEQIAVSDSGASVFQTIPTGNGSFVATAGPGNTGSGVINGGTVVDPAQWNAAATQNYTITFSVNTSGQTQYKISYTTPPSTTATTTSPANYTSGAAITLPNSGAQVEIQGQPANGDTFTIAPSTNQDLFTTVSNLAAVLKSSSTGTALANSLNLAQQNIGNALNHALGVAADVGARLTEVQAVKTAGSNTNLQYSQTLSNLQSLDYAAAVSTYQQDLTNLQAAQKSFSQLMGLSLFNYVQ